MTSTTNRRISLVAAGTLLTGTAAAATFGMLGAGAAGAATVPQSATNTAHVRSVDHPGKGSPDRIRLDAKSSSRDRHGSRDHKWDPKRESSREHKREAYREHKWESKRDSSRDHGRDHTRDHKRESKTGVSRN